MVVYFASIWCIFLGDLKSKKGHDKVLKWAKKCQKGKKCLRKVQKYLKTVEIGPKFFK